MKVSGLGQCSLDYIASVKKYPKEDTKEEALDFTVQGGGPAATALVSLRRLGVEASFMGVVSDDPAGTEIRQGLKREGIDIKGLKVRRGGKSQLAFIAVGKGKRTIFWQRPTVPELSPEEVDPRVIQKSGLLLLDGLMAGASLKAASIAKTHNVPIMLDAGRIRPGMLELITLSDYIVASEEFARGLAERPKEALLKLSKLRPRAVTITLGKKGSITWAEGKAFGQKAFKVKAVDTTGAGDVFHGGYCYGILKGWDIRKTVEFASAFAALKCLKPGGRAGIPNLKTVLNFIKTRKIQRQ